MPYPMLVIPVARPAFSYPIHWEDPAEQSAQNITAELAQLLRQGVVMDGARVEHVRSLLREILANVDATQNVLAEHADLLVGGYGHEV